MDYWDIYRKLTKHCKIIHPKREKPKPKIKEEVDNQTNEETSTKGKIQELGSKESCESKTEKIDKKRKLKSSAEEFERKRKLLKQEQEEVDDQTSEEPSAKDKIQELGNKEIHERKTEKSSKKRKLENSAEFERKQILRQEWEAVDNHISEGPSAKGKTHELGNKESHERKTEKSSKKRKLESAAEFERKQKLLKQEQVNHFRNLNKITVVGSRVPDPIRTFEELPIPQEIIENMKELRYLEPTPIQKQAIPVMLEGRQLLAFAPNGTGKTIAFLIPVIHHLNASENKGLRALILCPTRELVNQTYCECVKLASNTDVSVHTINEIRKGKTNHKTKQKFDILITTPNKLCYLLKQKSPAVSLANIEWLVLDEADKLFEPGIRSFREQIDEIFLASSNSERKIAMFSATFTPLVAKWCVKNMKGLVRVTVGHRNTAVESVDQKLLFVGNESGKLIAIRDQIREGIPLPAIIFVQSKEKAQQLFTELMYGSIKIDIIHPDRTQQQRDDAIQHFHEGKVSLLICTELMSRGIDFKRVKLVINYDFPPSVISYIHRVGRTGRAGQRGEAITYWTKKNTELLRSIAYIITQSGGTVPDFMLKMKKESKRKKKQLQRSAPKRKPTQVRSKFQTKNRYKNK